MIIDAHQHFWQRDLPFDYAWLQDPNLEKINQDYLPEHLAKQIEVAGVDRTIFVQTQHNVEENRWVLGLAENHDFIAGVVGWVDLASDACQEQLESFIDHPKFVGIRHVTQDEPDDDFIVRPEIIRGLKVLEAKQFPFDLLFYVKHLRHAETLGKELPNLPMVINHLAKPRIKEQITAGWIDDLKNASKHENIYCKLSGMITEADWSAWKPADLKPYVESALEFFGPDRCMFGTDWPVCELAGSYQQVYEALVEVLGPISDSERDAIFGKTANNFYGLGMDE